MELSLGGQAAADGNPPCNLACKMGTYANTRWVMAAEVLDGRSVLEACMGHTLNICQPCAAALTQELSPELGFHKQAHSTRGETLGEASTSLPGG